MVREADSVSAPVTWFAAAGRYLLETGANLSNALRRIEPGAGASSSFTDAIALLIEGGATRFKTSVVHSRPADSPGNPGGYLRALRLTLHSNVMITAHAVA